MEKKNGITNFLRKLIGILRKLIGIKAAVETVKTVTKPHEPIGSIGGKGHYFESIGAIERSFHCRSSQSKRRKKARRHAA